MADEIEIKEIDFRYAPEIAAIHRAIMKGNIPDSWMQSIELHLRKQDVVGYVAIKGGQVTGYIIGEIKGPSFGLEKSGWIIALESHPNYMGSGIGKALVESIFKYFKQTGVMDIYTALRWDAVDMVSFFISAGFNRSDFINLEKHLEDVVPE